MEKRSKRWTTDETKEFLHFYTATKEQFSHPRKKRSAYGSVVEDMIAAGFDSGFTSRHLEVKMQTLLRAYRDAKDNNGRTGASPCIAPFLEQMDELFAKKPNFSKSDSYNLGAESVLSSGATVSSPDTSSAAPLFSSPETFELDGFSASLEATPVSNDSDFFDVDVEFFLEEAAAYSSSLTTTTPPPPTTTTLPTTTTPPTTTPPPTRTPATLRPAAIKKRAMSRSDYYKEKLIQRQREAERVKERFQEREQARAQLQLKKAEDRKKKYELIEKMLSK